MPYQVEGIKKRYRHRPLRKRTSCYCLHDFLVPNGHILLWSTLQAYLMFGKDSVLYTFRRGGRLLYRSEFEARRGRQAKHSPVVLTGILPLLAAPLFSDRHTCAESLLRNKIDTYRDFIHYPGWSYIVLYLPLSGNVNHIASKWSR